MYLEWEEGLSFSEQISYTHVNIQTTAERNMITDNPSNDSISQMYTNNQQADLHDLEHRLSDYFANHVSAIDQCFQANSVIDRERFERLLRR